MFNNFDQLCLMAKGKIIYHNSADKAVNYFTTIGYKCPDKTNPADFFMNLMSIESYDEADGEDEDDIVRKKSIIQHDYDSKISDLIQKYENSELRNEWRDVHPEIHQLKDTNENFNGISK